MVVSSMQHHSHHQQQGAAPTHIQHPRPSSIVHQQHHAPPPQSQHTSAYSSTHSVPPVYQQQAQTTNTQQAQDLPYYAHPSPYSTPGTTSGYTSADTSDMMAATMPRPPYPPMSYHTPQSNSPASVASPSGHDQQRSLYGQPTSQLHQQSMYYGAPQQPQYGSMPTQQTASPYAQHTPQAQHQSITSQPNMMMSHASAQHQMTQQASQQAQAQMTASPRHTKMEPGMSSQQLQGSAQSASMGASQNSQPHMADRSKYYPPSNVLPMNLGHLGGQARSTHGDATSLNPNAAPGPIPATTPLVVRQDQNGVQWIAFEYSRDRVKMEYTIRCDVESVNTDELPAEFKTDNCVYPRACCPKEQYRGNRLQYETECNTVGWALAQLNPSLRGKRGLIQRAVDSWRNSNQDPRLRSRRVRRMAKMNNRKAVQAGPHPSHMAGPSGPPGMPGPGGMGPGNGAVAMAKAGMSSMGGMHHHQPHHDGNGQGGGDEVGDGDYMEDQHHHHHQPSQPSPASAAPDDVRQAQVFNQYGYPSNAPPPPPPMHHNPAVGRPSPHYPGHPIVARRSSGSAHGGARDTDPDDLFPDLPEAKKRKFILVEDNDRQSRLRVRVTLAGVDTSEIPDSFRKTTSVYPRSYFPREMQSPPPSATGSRFFQDDLSDDGEDDGAAQTEGRGAPRGESGRGTTKVRVSMGGSDSSELEIAIPRMRKATRGKEVRLNDLGHRMAWLQSRVFAGRTVFLQRALDCYRNKTRSAIEDVRDIAPHYETRVGKRKWNARTKRGERRDDEA